MDEKDFRNMLQAIDSMVSMGEHELAKEMALKAILHFKMSSGELENEKLKEVEVEFVKRYLDIAIHKGKQSVLDTLVNTALKTVVVLLVLFVFVGTGTYVLVGKKFSEERLRFASGESRRWNQFEAAISRNPYLYYRAALGYEKRREIKEAMYQMEKALSLSPDNKLYVKKLEELKKLDPGLK